MADIEMKTEAQNDAVEPMEQQEVCLLFSRLTLFLS
jgi:hypothetical protein